MQGDHSMFVWNLVENKQRFVLSAPKGQGYQTAIEISPDSRWIAALHFGGDVAKSFSRRTPDSRHFPDSPTGKLDVGVTTPVALAFGAGFGSMVHPDLEWFGDIWNAETGERHFQIHCPVNVENYAISPDGRYLAVGMRGGAVRVWDINAAKELFDWRPPFASTGAQTVPRQLAFTANSTALVIPDPSSPTLHLLDLTRLNQQLADVSLSW